MMGSIKLELSLLNDEQLDSLSILSDDWLLAPDFLKREACSRQLWHLSLISTCSFLIASSCFLHILLSQLYLRSQSSLMCVVVCIFNQTMNRSAHQQLPRLYSNRVRRRYLMRIWATSQTMNSLQSRLAPATPLSPPGPIGSTTSPSRCTLFLGSGAVRPCPQVEFLPGGRLLAQKSECSFSFMLPRADSQSRRMPVLLAEEVQQQLADLEDMSARQTPLPNMQPVAGASGGAILRPWLRMPTKLVSRLPCQSSILLSMCLVQRTSSNSHLRAKRSSRCSLYWEWVEAWVLCRQLLISLNSSLSCSTARMSRFSFLQLASIWFSSSLLCSMMLCASLISDNDSSISILALTLAQLFSTKCDMFLKPTSWGMQEQKSLVRSLMTLSLLPPLSSSISSSSSLKPFLMLSLDSFPSGILLGLQPISTICCFIILVSNISSISRLTGRDSLLSLKSSRLGPSSLLSFFSSFLSSSSSSQLSSTSRYSPFLVLSLSLRWNSPMALMALRGPTLLFCPGTPTLPHRVKKQQLLGLLSSCSTCRMQNLLLLWLTLVWLRVDAHTFPFCSSTWQLACFSGKYSSTGTFPFIVIFFIGSSPLLLSVVLAASGLLSMLFSFFFPFFDSALLPLLTDQTLTSFLADLILNSFLLDFGASFLMDCTLSSFLLDLALVPFLLDLILTSLLLCRFESALFGSDRTLDLNVSLLESREAREVLLGGFWTDRPPFLRPLVAGNLASIDLFSALDFEVLPVPLLLELPLFDCDLILSDLLEGLGLEALLVSFLTFLFAVVLPLATVCRFFSFSASTFFLLTDLPLRLLLLCDSFWVMALVFMAPK